jgi:hypothetical protein
VELRYESWTLRTGLAVSLVAYLALVVLVISGARRHRKGADKVPVGNAG